MAAHAVLIGVTLHGGPELAAQIHLHAAGRATGFHRKTGGAALDLRLQSRCSLDGRYARRR